MYNIRAELRAAGVLNRLSQLEPTIREALSKFLIAFSVRLSDTIQHNIIELFHSNGRLFNSVYVTRRDSTIVASVRDVPYARILEQGGATRPHVILPRNVSVLRWEGPSGLVFAKQVNHPGSVFPARPYVGAALAELRGDFDNGIREIVSSAVGPLQ